MPWVRFDDLYPVHRKVKGLSDAAYRLHSEAIFWCARNTTDGFVQTRDLSELATARRPHKLLPELVGRELWHRSDNACQSDSCPAHPDRAAQRPDSEGWLIHDYFDYQPTKAKVEAERKAKAQRQKRWLDKLKSKPRDASTDATRDVSKDANPAPPRPEGSGGGDASERRAPPASAPNGAGGARETRQRAQARALSIAACNLCDERGYQGKHLCDHDPAAAERNSRGAALARAALARRGDPP